MKTLRLLALTATLLLAWGCGDKNTPDPTPEPDPDPVYVTLRWDDLAKFDLSDVIRVDLVTGPDTARREVANGLITVPAIPSSVDAVRIYIPGNQGSIWLNTDDFAYAADVISVTRDLSGVTFVYNRETLELVNDALAGNYLQTDDIDLSAVENWNPIGVANNPFDGDYDGGGFAIRNMKVDITNANGTVLVGLFGINQGVLRNIYLEGGSASGEGSYVYCGRVCGLNRSGGAIISCRNTGSVNGKASIIVYCGGVCGRQDGGTITSCCNTGSVRGEGALLNLGGICGYNMDAIISCCNTGLVSVISTSSTAYCGGVCGWNTDGTITACYNIGSVCVDSTGGITYCGGVGGWNSSQIDYCYWGGDGNMLQGIAQNVGNTTKTMRFGDGENGTGWPDSSIQGWGLDTWASLGGWNDGDPVYPTLK